MVLMAGFEMPISAIRRMIDGAIEIIVQQDRLTDGRRVVTAVAAMELLKGENLRLTPRFYFDQKLESHRKYKNT